jgi:hypothetical protein
MRSLAVLVTLLALAFPQVLSHVPLDSDPLKYGIGTAVRSRDRHRSWRNHRL